MKGRSTHTYTHKCVHVYACFYYANFQNYISLCFCFCLCRHHCNPFHHRCSLYCVFVCVRCPSCAWPSLLLCCLAIYALEHSSESLVHTHTNTHCACVCILCVLKSVGAASFGYIKYMNVCVWVCVPVYAQAFFLSPLHTFWHAVALT